MDFQPLLSTTANDLPRAVVFVVRGTLYTESESEVWTLLSTLNAIERTGPVDAPKSTLDARDDIIRSLRDNGGFDPEVEVKTSCGILPVEEYSKRAFRAVFEYTPGADTKGIMSLKSLSIPFRLGRDAIHQPARALVFEHVTDLHIHFIREDGVRQTFQETLASLDRHLHNSVLFQRVTTLSFTGSFSHRDGERPFGLIAIDVDIQQLEFAPNVAGQVLVEEYVHVSAS